MSESCTLFCRLDVGNVDSFKNRLAMMLPETIEQTNDNGGWFSIGCRLKSGTITFTRRIFVEQADPFTKLRGNTIIKIRSKKESNPQGAIDAEKHVRSVNAIVGIVADPGFDQIDKLPELIAFLAMEYEALIFNGSEFLDFSGNSVFRL
jgi:hypothetical protein